MAFNNYNENDRENFEELTYRNLLKETDLARYISFPSGKRIWIPKSVSVIYIVSKKIEIMRNFYTKNNLHREK